MKQFTLILASPPYSGQDLDTVIGIADAALRKGHRVAVVGSGDGTYCFLKGQRASGAPNAEKAISGLIERGLQVDVWGTCFSFRGLRKEQFVEGANPGTLRSLFELLDRTDVLLSVGSWMENAMNRDILMVVRHGPYGGFQAAEALRHANGSLSLGFRPIVVLVDDGVYLAQTGQDPGTSEWLSLGGTLEEIIARGLYEKKDSPAEFYVDSDSLHQRGINLEDLVEGLEPIEHEKITNLMASHRLQLIF